MSRPHGAALVRPCTVGFSSQGSSWGSLWRTGAGVGLGGRLGQAPAVAGAALCCSVAAGVPCASPAPPRVPWVGRLLCSVADRPSTSLGSAHCPEDRAAGDLVTDPPMDKYVTLLRSPRPAQGPHAVPASQPPLTWVSCGGGWGPGAQGLGPVWGAQRAASAPYQAWLLSAPWCRGESGLIAGTHRAGFRSCPHSEQGPMGSGGPALRG